MSDPFEELQNDIQDTTSVDGDDKQTSNETQFHLSDSEGDENVIYQAQRPHISDSDPDNGKYQVFSITTILTIIFSILVFTDEIIKLMHNKEPQHENPQNFEAISDISANDAWQSIVGALMSVAATHSDGYPVEVIIGGNKRTFCYHRVQDITTNTNKCLFKCDSMDQVI